MIKILIGLLGLLVVSLGAYLTGEPSIRILGVLLITLGNFITFLTGCSSVCLRGKNDK